MTDPNDNIERNAVEDHGGILTIRGGLAPEAKVTVRSPSEE